MEMHAAQHDQKKFFWNFAPRFPENNDERKQSNGVGTLSQLWILNGAQIGLLHAMAMRSLSRACG